MTHVERLGLQCVKQAQDKWGARGWKLLSKDMQRAAVCEQAVSMILMVAPLDVERGRVAFEHVQGIAIAALAASDQ